MNDKLKLGECKGGLGSLIRPHFTEGLLLQDDDLTAGVSYTRELSRLMFRTLFGCGVLCGLRVSGPTLECGKLKIKVARGLALDCLGDPVEVQKPQTLEIDTCKFEIGTELWVGLKHTEKCCAPRTAVCSPDDDAGSSCTRERDGFELCIFSSRPPCSCGCAQLAPPAPPPAPDPAQPNAQPAAPPADAVALSVGNTTTAPAAAAPAAKDCGCGSSEEPPLETLDPASPCLCNKRNHPDSCNGKFYGGECACDCSKCDWIVLAKLWRADDDTETWNVDHSVRRFVRPVLMRDPIVAEERETPSGS